MFFLGAIAYRAAEIAAFVVVGDRIGFGWAALILIGVSALGPMAVRRVGVGALSRTQQRLAQGELPTREVVDGVVVLAGGVMICVPGFVSDFAGLLLMIGPVRHLVIRIAGHRLAHRVRHMRTGRWTVIDVGSQPPAGGEPRVPGPPTGSIGPGGDR